MANINLLPWREALRKEKQQQFLSIVVVVALIAFIIIYAITSVYDAQLSSQNARNTYLKNEIKLLDTRIIEIRDLRDTRKQLVERMELIQDLQGNRPVIVRIFDEVVRAVPEDLYFTSLSVDAGAVKVSGIAKSNNRVAALMRNFDQSEWFADPALLGVQAMDDGGNTFEVTMKLIEPKSPAVEER
jgi:type IV pilus assembly protein PilN